MSLNRIKAGVVAFLEPFPLGQRFIVIAFAAVLGLGILWAVAAAISQAYTFSHMSSAEHLETAKGLCQTNEFNDRTRCYVEAPTHLSEIPVGSPEYDEASKLLADLRQREHEDSERLAKGIFTCGTSVDRKPIMSFDGGKTWQWDDGRCAAQLQKARDDAAHSDSFWSTTLRVDTDMDSFWLNGEERTCVTYPDNKGRVAVVACNPTGSHRDRNIPVKFWGGVDRDTVSSWKCRREGDAFVCRAID